MVSEDLDEGEDVVPSTTVQTADVVSKLVNDLKKS
jgi:hypothetical protein